MSTVNKTKQYTKLLLIGSIILNIAFGIYIYAKHDQGKHALESVVFHGVQQNIVELEMSIAYQNDHGWTTPSSVTEKLDDVLEGIAIAIVSGQLSHALSKEQEVLLRDLRRFFNKLPQDSGFPNKVLDDLEINSFKHLQQSLKDAGWSSGSGYSSDWGSFNEKAKKLIESSFIY